MAAKYLSGSISIIVVNWNRCELLQACLESLIGQQGVDFEIIVVDNGSTDGSREVVAAVAAKTGGCPPIRLISNTENRGFCAANNQGFAASSAEFVALLNNDAEACPGWVAALLRAFESRPDVGMVASKILVYEDPSRIDKAGHLMYPDGQNRGRGSGQLDVGQFDQMEEALWPDGCAAMYRRAMLDEIGGFDEDFFAYADDAELGLRGRIAGWNCLYVPEAVVHHHRGATLGLDSARRLELIERNRILLAAKLFPWSLLWLNGGYYLLRVAASLWAAARGQGEAARFPGVRGKLWVAMALLKGNASAMLLLPKILRKRRQVRRFRKLTPREVKQLLKRFRISLREISHQAI